MNALELLESIQAMIDGYRCRLTDEGNAPGVVALEAVQAKLDELHDELSADKPA
jgi:hypothetical protein